MSISLSELRLAALPADALPGSDAFGVLEDSRLRRAFTDGIVTLSDAGGPSGAAQVADLLLYGVDAANTHGKPFVLSISEGVSSTEVKLSCWPYAPEDVVATASWEPADPSPLPGTFAVVEANGSGIHGHVSLITALSDEYIQIAVPFSSNEAVVSTEEEAILGVTLNGVTAEMTEDGRLSWSYTTSGANPLFTVSNASGVIATTTLSSLPSFPGAFTLSAVGGSGVSGTVRLDAAAGGGMSGKLALALVRGVNNLGHTEIGGDLKVTGDLVVKGALSLDADATVGGTLVVRDFSMRGLAAPIRVEPNGHMAWDGRMGQQVRIQKVFMDAEEAARSPSDLYFMPLMASGISCVLPQGWWASGNGFTIKAVIEWTRESTDDVNLLVDLFENVNGLSLINLIHENIADSYGPTSGEVFLEIHGVIERLEKEDENNGTEMMVVRGYYRMNDICELIPVIGEPGRGNYRLRILGGFTGTGSGNSIRLKGVTVSLSNAPSALEA